MVHTEVITLSEVVLKDAHGAQQQQQQPCGFMSVTLRIQVHCSISSSGSFDTNQTSSSTSTSTTAAPQSTDKVVVQVLRIDAHDLKDVEMGFLGMKSEEDQNDVYVKLRLGSFAEVTTDVRDNAGPAATFDFEAGHDAHTAAATAAAAATAGGAAGGAAAPSSPGGVDKSDVKPTADNTHTPLTSSATAPYRVSAVARARWEKVRFNLSAIVKMGMDMRRAKYAVLGRVGAEEFVGHREVEKRTFYPYSLVALEGE